jgi:hypothetical protein
MEKDTARDVPHGGWDQQTQSPDYGYDWHTMSAQEFHREVRREYDNTTDHTPEALASMPPHFRSDKVDKVADDDSNDGSEPVYTPPGSIEYKSPPFDKPRPEVARPKQTMAEASHAFEISDQVHKLILCPDHVSLHAVAIEKELKKCEAALSNIASSLPNANSYQAALKDRWAFLCNRYEMAKVGYFVPSKRPVDTVVPFGIVSKGAMASVETNVGRGMATPLVDESKDGRPDNSSTSPPVQTELRTLEELMEANFYSLTKTEKARVLLPLLTKVYPATEDSSHSGAFQQPEDAASLKNQFGSNHAPSIRPTAPFYKVHTHRKSSPKAFNNVLHEISKGTDGRTTALSRPIHGEGYNRPSKDVATSSSSDRIEMTVQAASSKSQILDQKLNDPKNFNDDVNLTPRVSADSMSILSENVRTQIRSQFENNRGDRTEQSRYHALHRPYVVDDEVLSAHIARQFEDAKGMTPSLHNPDSFDPAHFVADPELSKLLSKMSLREDIGGSVQGSDQDKPDWFESLVQDEDDDVYIGDPSSSPWQSQNQGDSNAPWGGQVRHASCEPSRLEASASPAASPCAYTAEPVGEKMPPVWHMEDVTSSPRQIEESLFRTGCTPDRDLLAPLMNAFLEQAATLLAPLRDGPIKLRSLELIDQMIADVSEHTSATDVLTSNHLARCLKSVKASQPGRFVPFSPAKQMQRASQSERVLEDFAEKSQHGLRRENIDDHASACSDSTTGHVSPAYDREVTNFDRSDDSDSGSFKNSFSPCDSCGSIDTFEDTNGSGCMSCGCYTEPSIASREWAREAHRGQEAVPKEAAAIAPPKVSADDGRAAPVRWGVPSVQRAESDGWAAPLVQDADTTGDDESSGDGWPAMSRDAVWRTDSIAEEDRLLANMAEDSLRMCEERSELLEPVQPERKLTKKEKKRLLKTKKQPKETKQSKNKKKKHAKAAVSKDFAVAKQDTSHKPAAKLDSSLFDLDTFETSGGDSHTARGDEYCWEGTASINAKLGTDGDGKNPESCTQDEHSERWSGDRLYSADAWGWSQSRKGTPVPSYRAFNTTPKPAASTRKNYTITYWATVECGDQTIHIPIDDSNISGPEKTVLEGPAKKVWKWVQEKGLGGRVGLQDAFDLAKDLRDDDEKEVTGSSPWPKPSPPPSLHRSPSPARTEQYVGRCRGCDEPDGWCVCED